MIPVESGHQRMAAAGQFRRPAHARRKRQDIEIGDAVVGEAAEIKVGNLLLATPTAADVEIAAAGTLLPIHRHTVAVALRIIQRRLRAAAVGCQLVDARAGLYLSRAGQPQSLVISRQLDAYFTAFGQHAHVGGAVGLAVLVVVAITVGFKVVDGHANAHPLAAVLRGDTGFTGAVGSGARAQAAGSGAIERGTGDDVDHTADRAFAIQHRAAAAHDLDALDIDQRKRRPLHAGQVVVGDAPPVDQNQRVLGAGNAKAAQIDRGRRRVVAEKIMDLDAGLLGQQVGNGFRRAAPDVFAGNHRHVDRFVIEAILEPRGGHHHFVECGDLILRRAMRAECQRDCHCQNISLHVNPRSAHPPCAAKTERGNTERKNSRNVRIAASPQHFHHDEPGRSPGLQPWAHRLPIPGGDSGC